MLLRVQTDSIRRLLAELQEPAQLIPKLGEDLQKLAIGPILVQLFRLTYIVSRYIDLYKMDKRERKIPRKLTGLIKGLGGAKLKVNKSKLELRDSCVRRRSLAGRPMGQSRDRSGFLSGQCSPRLGQSIYRLAELGSRYISQRSHQRRILYGSE